MLLTWGRMTAASWEILLPEVNGIHNGVDAFKLPIGEAEVSHLVDGRDRQQLPIGEEYLNIARPGSPRTTVREPDKAEALHWMSRLFRREFHPEPHRVLWQGSTLTTPMGTFENVHAAFTLDGRKVVWADGFSKEDPRACNPVWMWIELRPGEIDAASEATTHASVSKFIERYFNLYDRNEGLRVQTYYDGATDAFGYWGLSVSQYVPGGLPSVCGWMKQMGVKTNGKHLFVTILYCTDTTFDWQPKKSQLFRAANAAFRTRSRFTGEPLRYSQALVSPSGG